MGNMCFGVEVEKKKENRNPLKIIEISCTLSSQR